MLIGIVHVANATFNLPHLMLFFRAIVYCKFFPSSCGMSSQAEGMRVAWGRTPTLRRQRGFWRAVVLNDPALRRWRKEAVAAVAVGNWLLRR